MAAGRDDLLADRVLMRVIVDPPREMVDAADAPRAARTDRHLAEVDDARGVGKAVTGPAVLFAETREAERAGEKRGGGVDVPLPQLRAVEPANLPLRRNRAAVPRRERPPPCALDERDLHPVRIDEWQDLLAESRLERLQRRRVLLQPRAPVVEAARRNLERHFGREAVAKARRRHLRPRKKGEVRPWMSLGVGVEEVVRAGIVLIHALLDEPHAEDAGVEVEILLRRSRDRCDVMQSVDASHAELRRNAAHRARFRSYGPIARVFSRRRALVEYVIEHSLVLAIGSAIALVWANTPDAERYSRIAARLAFLVNDVGMVFFFALAAKEIVEATAPGGALHTWRRAALPAVAAVGGMIVPALVYVAYVTYSTEIVPMAGLGGAVRHRHRLQLSRREADLPETAPSGDSVSAALAIADDALGLVILAAFYPVRELHLLVASLLMATALIAAFALRRAGVRNFWRSRFGGITSWGRAVLRRPASRDRTRADHSLSAARRTRCWSLHRGLA